MDELEEVGQVAEHKTGSHELLAGRDEDGGEGANLVSSSPHLPDRRTAEVGGGLELSCKTGFVVQAPHFEVDEVRMFDRVQLDQLLASILHPVLLDQPVRRLCEEEIASETDGRKHHLQQNDDSIAPRAIDFDSALSDESAMRSVHDCLSCFQIYTYATRA